jgi:hypothetical protein
MEGKVRRSRRQREMHRAIMARSRQRRKAGRVMVMVEVEEAMIEILVREGLLRDGASGKEIAGAIARLVRSRDLHCATVDCVR